MVVVVLVLSPENLQSGSWLSDSGGIAPYLYHFAPIFRVVAELLGVKLGSTGPRDLKRLMEKENSPMAIVPGGLWMTQEVSQSTSNWAQLPSGLAWKKKTCGKVRESRTA